MESKESSSSTAAAEGSRDGSTEEDGKGILSVTAGLAKDAALLFQSGRFAECAILLNQLLQKKEDDPKILHNIAVAEYFRDGCSDPKRLLHLFNHVKKRSEELAHVSGVPREISSNLGSNLISGSKGCGTSLHQFSAANTASIAYADEFDTSIMTLNMAVVLYHLQEYTSSLSLLEPLYQNIEPLDETTALHVCFLYLDAALASNDASRAADVIQYLERAFGVGHMLSQESGFQHASSNQAVKASMSLSGFAEPATDASGSDPSGIVNTTDTMSETLSVDAIEYDNLISTLDNSEENLRREISSGLTGAPMDVPAIDLKLKLQLYKVQLLLFIRNLKGAKREMKLAMNHSHGRDSSKALLLKAQLEYARGNYQKAIKLIGNRKEAGISSMLSNNLGCIFHQLKKHHASSMLFSNSLKISSSLRAEKPLKLHTFSQDKSLLIVYNLGVQNLFCGRPLAAAHCFHKASPAFYKQPLLWLRFAECCLLALEKGLLTLNESSNHDFEEARVYVVGSGKWRHLNVFPKSRNRTSDTMAEDGLVTKDGQCRLSIPLARRFLLNALHLLNELVLEFSKAGAPAVVAEEDESSEVMSVSTKNSSNATSASILAVEISDNREMKDGFGSSSLFWSSICSYKNKQREEYHVIKQVVLANLAFVELCLENPLRALLAAKTLQEIPDCSRMYVFLGRVYAAEALCHLNRPKEAAECLSVYVSNGSNVEQPYSKESIEKWSLEKEGEIEEISGALTAKTTFTETPQNIKSLTPEDSRGVLLVNFASLCATQGDLDNAVRFVTEAISIIPNNPQAFLAAVYIDLLQGKTEDAIIKLKRCNNIRFLRRAVELNKS